MAIVDPTDGSDAFIFLGKIEGPFFGQEAVLVLKYDQIRGHLPTSRAR
jgi:hypothetical protein